MQEKIFISTKFLSPLPLKKNFLSTIQAVKKAMPYEKLLASTPVDLSSNFDAKENHALTKDRKRTRLKNLWRDQHFRSEVFKCFLSNFSFED